LAWGGAPDFTLTALWHFGHSVLLTGSLPMYVVVCAVLVVALVVGTLFTYVVEVPTAMGLGNYVSWLGISWLTGEIG
jgi:hypothetical protein